MVEKSECQHPDNSVCSLEWLKGPQGRLPEVHPRDTDRTRGRELGRREDLLVPHIIFHDEWNPVVGAARRGGVGVRHDHLVGLHRRGAGQADGQRDDGTVQPSSHMHSRVVLKVV
jgi:hypothetical protein